MTQEDLTAQTAELPIDRRLGVASDRRVDTSVERRLANPAERRGRPRTLLHREGLIRILTAHIDHKYKTNTNAAKAWGCSASFVSAVLKSRRPPTDIMLKELGYERIDTYVRLDSAHITAAAQEAVARAEAAQVTGAAPAADKTSEPQAA